jgi:hypothetical protein
VLRVEDLRPFLEQTRSILHSAHAQDLLVPGTCTLYKQVCCVHYECYKQHVLHFERPQRYIVQVSVQQYTLVQYSSACTASLKVVALSCVPIHAVTMYYITVERPLALSPAVTDAQLSLLGAASLRGNPRFRILYLHGWKQSATKFKNLTKQLRRKLEPLAGER